MLELLNMPAFCSGDPASVPASRAFRLIPLDEEQADPDTLYKASCAAAEMEAMARTLEIRIKELREAAQSDSNIEDDILKLSAQEQMFREIASQLRCTRNKSSLNAALSSAAIAQSLFGIARSMADHAMQDAEHEAAHGAAAKAVAAAKACYDVPIRIIRARSIFIVKHELSDVRLERYARYETDYAQNPYMRDPSTTDVLLNFKETLGQVQTSLLTPEQQGTLRAINVALNDARVSAFNVTDKNVNDRAISVTVNALGEDYAERFADKEHGLGMDITAFLEEARLQRGFAPVDAMRMAEYKQKIDELSRKQQRGTLSQIDTFDLECYRQALMQAEVINTYFESRRELQAATTIRAQTELLLVQDNLAKLDGLPPEAIDVHLQEAQKRIDALKSGTPITEEDVEAATQTIKERLQYFLTPVSPDVIRIPQLISKDTLGEVHAAADVIKMDMAQDMCACALPYALNRFQAPQFEMA